MRYAPVAMCLLALCISSSAFAVGANPQVTLPLHARLTSGSCTQFSPVNCTTVLPTFDVAASTDYMVYLLIMNYNAAAGVQTAFDWDAGWVLQDVLFNCRAGQVNATIPDPLLPGGPTTGTAASAFTCVNGPALAAIGRLAFTTGTQGCLFQVQSSYPFGDHVVDCANQIDQINPLDPEFGAPRLGKICIGAGGRHACDPVNAVEASTWGSIKATYNR